MDIDAMREAPPGPVPRGLPEATFTDPATIRLISTAHLTEPALTPLADDAASLALLADLEQKTSRRQDRLMPLPAGVSRKELLTEAHGYGWTYVNAAFCYTRPGGNRFNGPERGAWYAAWGPEAGPTGRAEVAWHLTRELAAVGVFENVTLYRELLAGFTARFADLRADPAAPWLDPDPARAYPEGQALAREMLGAGVGGVLYPSARHPGGDCLAAFRPTLVQNVRQGATWRLAWTGSPEPEISAYLG